MLTSGTSTVHHSSVLEIRKCDGACYKSEQHCAYVDVYCATIYRWHEGKVNAHSVGILLGVACEVMDLDVAHVHRVVHPCESEYGNPQ